jgi:hypothetical protein
VQNVFFHSTATFAAERAPRPAAVGGQENSKEKGVTSFVRDVVTMRIAHLVLVLATYIVLIHGDGTRFMQILLCSLQ